MKQIITTLVISFLITSANAHYLSNNPLLKNHFNKTVNGIDRGKNGLNVIPNPKTGDIQVSFKSAKAGKATIVVLDESGKTVLTQKVQLAAGKNNININNFNDLAEGDYTVCLNTNYGAYSSPFLLWK
jgi:hypothetical protein